MSYTFAKVRIFSQRCKYLTFPHNHFSGIPTSQRAHFTSLSTPPHPNLPSLGEGQGGVPLGRVRAGFINPFPSHRSPSEAGASHNHSPYTRSTPIRASLASGRSSRPSTDESEHAACSIRQTDCLSCR